MKEHPLIFSAEMVRAVLADNKTQTRRVITRRNKYAWQVGERMWLREKWRTAKALDDFPPRMTGDKSPFQYAADMSFILHGNIISRWQPWGKWHPSIHMPRWASRITLEIINIRVEQIQDITPEDAGAEGCGINMPNAPIASYYGQVGKFHALWDSINAKRGYGWDANPAVKVISFKIIEVKNGTD